MTVASSCLDPGRLLGKKAVAQVVSTAPQPLEPCGALPES